MDGKFRSFIKKDKRQRIIKYHLNEFFKGKLLIFFTKKFKQDYLESWENTTPIDSLVIAYFCYQNAHNNFRFFTNTNEPKTTITVKLDSFSYFYYALSLKIDYSNLYFPIDMSIYKNNNNICGIISFSSYFSYNYQKIIYNNNLNKIYSISYIYKSFSWIERELSELNQIYFLNLKDGRRLLTNYTIQTNDVLSYKTTSYDLLTQDLY